MTIESTAGGLETVASARPDGAARASIDVRVPQRRQRFVVVAFALLALTPLPSNALIVPWSLACVLVIVHVTWRPGALTRALAIVLLMITAIAVVALLRGLTLGTPVGGMLRDLLDAFRFVPAVVAATSLVRGSNGIDLTPTLAVICVVDAAISLAQFLRPEPFRLLYALHGTVDPHWTIALNVSSRASGLYGSPGEHGSAMALFGVLLLFRYLRSPRPLLLAGFASSVLGLLLSQSQTSFLAFVIGCTAALTWALLHTRRSSTLRAARWLILLAAVIGPVLLYLTVSRLRYLVFLFTTGSSRSSYQLREDLWAEIWQKWDDHLVSVLLGGGRTWLGHELTSVVDSDLRFVLYVHGIVGLVALIGGFVAWVGASQVVPVEAFTVLSMTLVSSWANSLMADARMLSVAVILLVFHGSHRFLQLRQSTSNSIPRHVTHER